MSYNYYETQIKILFKVRRAISVKDFHKAVGLLRFVQHGKYTLESVKKAIKEFIDNLLYKLADADDNVFLWITKNLGKMSESQGGSWSVERWEWSSSKKEVIIPDECKFSFDPFYDEEAMYEKHISDQWERENAHIIQLEKEVETAFTFRKKGQDPRPSRCGQCEDGYCEYCVEIENGEYDEYDEEAEMENNRGYMESRDPHDLDRFDDYPDEEPIDLYEHRDDKKPEEEFFCKLCGMQIGRGWDFCDSNCEETFHNEKDDSESNQQFLEEEAYERKAELYTLNDQNIFYDGEG